MLQACRQLKICISELCLVPCLDKIIFNENCATEDYLLTPESPFHTLPQPNIKMKWYFSLSTVKAVLLSQLYVCQKIHNLPSHPKHHLHNPCTTHTDSQYEPGAAK